MTRYVPNQTADNLGQRAFTVIMRPYVHDYGKNLLVSYTTRPPDILSDLLLDGCEEIVPAFVLPMICVMIHAQIYRLIDGAQSFIRQIGEPIRLW